MSHFALFAHGVHAALMARALDVGVEPTFYVWLDPPIGAAAHDE